MAFGADFFRVAFAVFLAVGGLLLGGCSSVLKDENLELFAMNAPLPKLVPKGTELAAARQAASQAHGCLAVQGAGCSMEPVYLSGTAVVVRVGGFDKLRPGMPVIYQTRSGSSVAHMVVRRTDEGWVAVGLNNAGEDLELVTSENLVGVITQAFASNIGPLPKAVAARMGLDEIARAKVASLSR
jgi:hypothetical protein